MEITTLYVPLLEEGSPTLRRAKANDLGNGTFKLLVDSDYDSEDEIWEFLPGSIVRCETKKGFRGEDILVAIEKIK